MDLDINTLRMVVTVASFALFVALMVTTWTRRRKAAFDEAARLPFVESEAPTEQAGARQ